MTICLLHLSDFHIKERASYDSDVVLRTLVEGIERFRQTSQPPDLICISGDLTYSGQEGQFEALSHTLDAILKAAGLDRNRLVVVPGNHDVDRRYAVPLGRTLKSGADADAYFDPAIEQPHLVQGQAAFRRWHTKYFGERPQRGTNPTCGPIKELEIRGTHLCIVPMNTAVFCQGDDDHAKLWIGRRCLGSAMEDLRKLKADWRIIVCHHPLDWLHGEERTSVKTVIQQDVDLVLRGHLHELEFERIESGSGTTLYSAAGAAYDTREWPNSALYLRLLENRRVTVMPIRYVDKPRQVWTIDPSLFPLDAGYERTFALHSGEAAADAANQPSRVSTAQLAFRSNIPSRYEGRFIGREPLLKHIREQLSDVTRERVLVLRGSPGVGKTELAFEVARREQRRYPGGTFVVDMSSGSPPSQLVVIGRAILGIDVPGDLSLEDQCLHVLHRLWQSPALLVYDGVRSEADVRRWLPPAGQQCHVLITTLVEMWSAGLVCSDVHPLDSQEQYSLIEAIAGPQVAHAFGARLIENAKGVTVQLAAAAAALAYESRRGRLSEATVHLTREAIASFRGAWVALDETAKLVLYAGSLLATDRLPRGELVNTIKYGLDRTGDDCQRGVDQCCDVHLLQGDSLLRMHSLIAEFVRAEAPRELPVLCERVIAMQMTRFALLCDSVCENPGDVHALVHLSLYPETPGRWRSFGVMSVSQIADVAAMANLNLGRYESGLVWANAALEGIPAERRAGVLRTKAGCLVGVHRYDEAITALDEAFSVLGGGDEQAGDLRSSCLYQRGYCLSSKGLFREALGSYRDALALREGVTDKTGAHYGRIGATRHEIAYCLAMLGEHEEAQRQYAQAAEEKAREAPQRDSHSLGMTLYNRAVGVRSQGRSDSAKDLLERAGAAFAAGDEHGRIDNAAIGRTLCSLGGIALQGGYVAEAKAMFERGCEFGKLGNRFGKVENDVMGMGVGGLGQCLFIEGKYDEAREVLARAKQICELAGPDGRVDETQLGLVYMSMGQCDSVQARWAEGKAMYGAAISHLERGSHRDGVSEALLGRAIQLQASCSIAVGDAFAALSGYQRAIEHLRRAKPSESRGMWLMEALTVGAVAARMSGVVSLAMEWEGELGRLSGMQGSRGAARAARIGRNDPCYCGSGKKFKRCHGR